jgi:dTDP-4-dehydrorhamnose 3,5-epimerase
VATDVIIQGVTVRELHRYRDERGWLFELFRQDEIARDLFPVMGYVSCTLPGVVRGPHEHRDQTDFFGFVGPSDFRVYLWDNRPDSPTHGEAWQVTAGESNPCVVVIPPGVVHAYKNTGSVPGLVFNGPNRLYRGEGKQDPVDEIRHEDDPQSPFRVE